MFKQAVQSGAEYCVVEVTSHAIDQLRIWGCHFKIAALTNITNEHLDYHRTFNEYAKTKLQLINNADLAVVNAENKTLYKYRKLITNKNIWFSAVSRHADINYDEVSKLGVSKTFVGFEKQNVLLAYSVCKLLGFPPVEIVNAVNTFVRVKGRFDYFEKNNISLLVDFAHTPNAYSELYQAIKERFPKKKIIHVFGCAGLRDHYKRPAMGEIAGRYASTIVLTEEDYRTEKFEDIAAEIEKGIKKNKLQVKDSTYFFIKDRQEAVNFALSKATKNSLVVFTGKSHEKSLARGKKEDPYDEYEAIDKGLATIM